MTIVAIVLAFHVVVEALYFIFVAKVPFTAP